MNEIAAAINALAEQQRIANLLAFAAFTHETPDGAVLATTLDGAVMIRTMVGEALGVPDSAAS